MGRNIVCKCLAANRHAVYSIVCDDVTLCESVIRVFSSPTDKLKLRTIEVLVQALLQIKKFVKHEDTLIIQLENQHLINWLIDETEYKGYDTLKDAINLIDTLDCVVRFEKRELRRLSRVLRTYSEEGNESEDTVSFEELIALED